MTGPALDSPYHPDAVFRCNRSRMHGQWKRKDMPILRGRLECPKCRAASIRSELTFIEPENQEGDTSA